MNQQVISADQTKINYEVTGKNKTALLFVHGWMGNVRWWDSERDYFSGQYQVVQMDLAGHGKSGKTRKNWSVKTYAEDIKAVADSLDADRIILVGHSMSGLNVVEASLLIEKTAAIILVDTLHNLEQRMPEEQANQFLNSLRQDYPNMVRNTLPQYLFVKESPPLVVEKILEEFLQHTPESAATMLEPNYKTDMRESARRVKVPVRGLNSNLFPTDASINKKYFSDFDFEIIPGVGHYPMLEKSEEFNHLLEKVLTRLGF